MPAGSAHELAVAALDTSAELHAAYRPTRSPKLGNLAFHVGLRDRALCCHWTRDLLHTLSALDLKGVELHGHPMPEVVLDSIRRNRVGLKGPLGTPKGGQGQYGQYNEYGMFHSYQD